LELVPRAARRTDFGSSTLAGKARDYGTACRGARSTATGGAAGLQTKGSYIARWGCGGHRSGAHWFSAAVDGRTGSMNRRCSPSQRFDRSTWERKFR
jgi:hypothetical protein